MKKLKQKSNKGITLIALVITIIVLLILAAVSIATLTGENGILSQATKAREANNKADVEERVKLEVMASYGDDGKFNMDKLKDNLKDHLKVAEVTDTVEEENRRLEFGLDGYDVEVDSKGKVTLKGTTPVEPEKSELEEAKESGHVYQKDEDREIEDAYGNKVVVPEGFKVVEGENVTQGIVIEDATYEETKGSQFVWIPVGTVYTNKNKSEFKTIELNRYTFADDEHGTEIKQNQDLIESRYQELKTSNKGNATAKGSVYDAFTQKEDGKTKVEKSGGYYIGRYEARIEGYTGLDIYNNNSISSWTGYTGGKLVEKSEEQVFNYITQNKASELCKKMYNNTSYEFESDLVNSYAWDTAIVFIQKFSIDGDYSWQNSLYTSDDNIATKGTKELEEGKQDVRCNIWDMASNCFEWTTETSSLSDSPSVYRGGVSIYDYNYTSSRGFHTVANSGTNYKFFAYRPILIV